MFDLITVVKILITDFLIMTHFDMQTTGFPEEHIASIFRVEVSQAGEVAG
jgi:hypothetical protein